MSLRPPLAFNPRPRRLLTPTDAYELHPGIRLYRTALSSPGGVSTPGTPGGGGGGGASSSPGGSSPASSGTERDKQARRHHSFQVQLALRTLGTFPFGASVLLGFVRRNVVEYLDDDDPSTRREAALTCCRLLELRSDRVTRGGGDIGTSIHGGDAALMALNANSASVSSVSHASHVTNGAPSRWSAWTEEFIMSRLLAVAVSGAFKTKVFTHSSVSTLDRVSFQLTDELFLYGKPSSDLDANVRRAVLASFLRPCPSVDSHLGQADALRALFITLNDESAEVRLLAIRLVGRLAPRNPAYALPALRRHLLQLLTELEHSTESHLREESARLMATLVRSCTRLVMPYIAPILRTLMMKLRKPEEVAAAKASAATAAEAAGIAKRGIEAAGAGAAAAAGQTVDGGEGIAAKGGGDGIALGGENAPPPDATAQGGGGGG